MIKSLTFLKRKPGLSREEFLRHWKEKHGPLAAKVVPGLKKYVQCHPVPGIESDIDGIVELWWDSPESFQAFLSWRQSDAAKVLKEDEEKFVEIMKEGVSLAAIGQVTDSEVLEIYGLDGNRVLLKAISELKEAWQKPIRW